MTAANANADLAPPVPVDVEAPVEVEALAYTFVGRDRPSLRDISFCLPVASWTLVAGRTGSGKSTLLRALAGLIPHHAAGQMQGCVRLLGADTRTLGPADLARRVGLILQSPDDQLCATTVEAEVAFGLENLGLPAREIGLCIDTALDAAGLAGLRRRPTRHLSGGQKQRLLLASIRVLEPRVLLLDEPLAQLDPFAAADLLGELDRLRSQGVTIVVAEHRLDELAARADRVLVLDEGRLVDDLPAAGAGLCDGLARHGLAPPEVSQLAQTLRCGPLRTATELFERLDTRGFSRHVGAACDGEPHEIDSHKVTVREAARTAAPAAGEPRPVLRVENLGYRFPGNQAWVWRGLAFALHEGECVALVGANGSGKSTLLHLLAGLARPTAGRIESQRVAEQSFAGAVGLVPQNPDLTLFCARVRDEIAFGPRQFGVAAVTIESRVAELARHLNLESLLDEPPLALSQGQRLRTAVAAALSVEPRVLLLDEPTTGQDRRQVERVMVAIRDALRPPRAAGCVLFSTHDLSIVARHARRVLVLADGKLAADCTPDELLTDDSLLARAHLRRPPLLEVRHRLALRGMTVAEMAEEMQAQATARQGVDRHAADRHAADRHAADRQGADPRGAGP